MKHRSVAECLSCLCSPPFLPQPENVLLTETRVIKLADFGLAIDLNEEKANTRAGTIGA